MTEPIKPIETHYKGYRFRSRLEARWAVYFDALGLEWVYEPQGFQMKNPHSDDTNPFPDPVFYLPDFWLPQVQMWAEVKPEDFDDFEWYKAALLSCLTGKQVLMLVGVPEAKPYYFLEYGPANTWGYDGIGEGEYTVEQIDCVISMYHNYPTSEHRFYSNTGGVDQHHDFSPFGMFSDVPAAVAAARSARFEYGETPR